MSQAVQTKTFRQGFELYLKKNGLFDSQIASVLTLVEEEFKPSCNLMDLQEWNYSQKVIDLQYHLLDQITLRYIDAECPQAWFRPVFDKSHPLWKEIKG